MKHQVNCMANCTVTPLQYIDLFPCFVCYKYIYIYMLPEIVIYSSSNST